MAKIKSYAQTLLQFLFLIVFVGIFAILQSRSNQWDYMVFTQQWPQAACVDINNTHSETCILPKNVKTWTIHGIWPNRYDGKGPFFCNNSYPFREEEIAGLEPELFVFWPNLIIQTSKTSFWKHEWVKHGTCGTTLEAIDTETKYFAKGLHLNKQYNLQGYLANSNIVPSQETYELKDIRSAIEDSTNSKVRIQCIFSKDKTVQAVIQVEICLKKDFSAVDCPLSSLHANQHLYFTPSWIASLMPYNPSYEDCSESKPVQYISMGMQNTKF